MSKEQVLPPPSATKFFNGQRYAYAFAYGRLRCLLEMATYDLDHGRARDLLADELRRTMREIEADRENGRVW